jgi:ADP-ribose pyrophosphatase YjhB (NUDIX family)
MIRDESFGIIPLQKRAGVWHLYLVQHHMSGYWGFPKGHAEISETPQQTAMRELKEETHLEVVRFLLQQQLKEEFVFRQNGVKVFKTVYYFVAEVGGEAQLVYDQEIIYGKWVTLSEAATVMTHASGKALCEMVTKIVRD